MDEFTKGYLEAAFWVTEFDSKCTINDILPESMKIIEEECIQFQKDNWEYIQDNLSQAGQDFWLTRNKHGSGFWDGDWEHKNLLTDAAHKYGECYLVDSDDNKVIYHSENWYNKT